MEEKAISYVPVRVSTLRGDQKIAFDLYIQLGAKHVLYIRRGDSFEGSRLDRLKERKLRKMFIQADDEKSYRDYMTRNIEMAYDTKSAQSAETRAQVIQGLQQSAAEGVMENPADAAAYDSAKEGSRKFADYLMREDKALKSLLAIENADQNLAHHGVTVASIAIEIAKRTGYQDTRNLHFLALGCLIHDLGHYASGQNVAQPLAAFSPEELAKYKEHPSEGARLVKDLKHLDQHVTQIILEHEEHVDGSGYPKKLLEKQMNPLSVFAQTANAYDRMVTFEKESPPEAIKRLFLEKIGRHPLPHLNALKAIVQESQA